MSDRIPVTIPGDPPGFGPLMAKRDSIWGLYALGMSQPEAVQAACEWFADAFGFRPNARRMALRIGAGRSPVSAACAERAYQLALELCPERRAWRPASHGQCIGM